MGGYDRLVYNVIWGGGSAKIAIFALYNMCTAPYVYVLEILEVRIAGLPSSDSNISRSCRSV